MAKTTRRVRVALGEALHPVGEIVFEFDGRREACIRISPTRCVRMRSTRGRN